MLWYVLNRGGGNISRVLIIGSNEGRHSKEWLACLRKWNEKFRQIK